MTKKKKKGTGHVSKGAAPLTATRLTESYRNNVPQEGFGGALVGLVFLANPHRLQLGSRI